MSYWLDYSAAKLSGQTIRSAGYTGVIRYIDSPLNLSQKHTNRSEYRSHVDAGLGVNLVMQTSTSASDGGSVAGRDHAIRARDGADFIGFGGRIFFTNDRTTLPSTQRWDDYLTAACDVLGPERVGAYGFANAMDVARHQTPVTAFWLAGSASGVAPRPYLNFWQDNNTQVTVGGVLCDRNLVLLGDDMALTDADIAIIAKGVDKWMLDNVGSDGRNVRDTIRQGAAWSAEAVTVASLTRSQVLALTAKLDTILDRPDVSGGASVAEIRSLLSELRLVVGVTNE